MNTADFVYKQVLSGSLNAGVRLSIATNAATQALSDWKKSRFLQKRADQLIEQSIKDAKRANGR